MAFTPPPPSARLPGPARRPLLAALLVLAALPLPARAAEQPQRILVFGDSQAQGVTAGLQRLYRGDRLRRIIDKSKIATGLIPRPGFDWPLQAETLAATEKAEVAVAFFGANDRPPIRLHNQVDPDLLEQFTLGYGDTVSSIARDFKQAGLPLVWLGHPIVRDPVMAEDIALLNTLYADRATAEGATFLPTWDRFLGPDGKFAPYGPGIDGQTTRLRADDGIHMTPAGYDVIAAMLAPLLAAHPAKPA